jgi:hypothetical protein
MSHLQGLLALPALLAIGLLLSTARGLALDTLRLGK